MAADLWADFDDAPAKPKAAKPDDVWADFDAPPKPKPAPRHVAQPVAAPPPVLGATPAEHGFAYRAIDAIDNVLAAPARGLMASHPLDAIKRGATSALATAGHTASDFIDQTIQQPLRNILQPLGIMPDGDPLGAQHVADQTLGVEREINAERQHAAQALPKRPTLGEFAQNPADAIQALTHRVSEQGAESLPTMALALATKNPELAAGILGGTTGAQEYTDLRSQGIDRAPAALAGVGQGAMEVAGEEFGLPFVLGKLGPNSLRRALAAEFGQEFVTQLGQQNLEDVALGHQTPVGQQFSDALDAGLVGSALGGGGHVAVNAPAAIANLAQPAPLGAAVNPPPDAAPSSAIDPLDARAQRAADGLQRNADVLGHRDIAPPEPTDDLDSLLAQLPPEIVAPLAQALGAPEPAPPAAATARPDGTPAAQPSTVPAATPPTPSPAEPAGQPSFAQQVAATMRNSAQVKAARATPTTAPAVQPVAERAGSTPAAGDLTPDPLADLSRAQQALSAERAKPKPQQDRGKLATLNADVERAQGALGGGKAAVDPTMQNRDRSRAASVAQMQDIRKQPDPERLGFSRDPNTGAPMVAEGRALPDADKGRADTVVMASGRRVPVRYGVVEAADLAASHDADGKVNPGYADAPLKALNNGRTAGLQAAYATGNTDAYRAGIAADSGLHGVSPEAIASKRQPVLVRLYDPAQNAGDMGAESNATQQLGLSPVEQAQTDARALPDLSGVQWAEDGSLAPGANANFFRAWFQRLGDTQAASLQDAHGRPNAAAIQRVRAAMVDRAYGDERLLTAMAEDVNPDNRNVLNALVQAAPAFATLDRAGLVDDVRAALVGGLEALRDAASRGLSLHDALAQGDLLGRNANADAVARFMAANARSPRRMAEAFKAMAEYAADAETQSATLDVFGTAPSPTVSGALNRAGIDHEAGTDAGRVAEGTGRREPAQDEGAAAGDAFALATPDARAEAPRPVASQSGLFAPPTRGEQIRAASEAKDASRNGLGRDLVRPSEGDGELLAGDRPTQTDVDEAQELTRDQLPPEAREVLDRERNRSLAREKARALSQAQGEADADANGSRAAIEKVLGGQAKRVEFVRDYAGLPEDLHDGVEARNASRDGKVVTAAIYEPATQRVFVVTSVVKTADRAVWNAMHEIAGHDGLRKLLGQKLEHALQIALQNPTVKALADAIAADRSLRGDQRMLAAEEALAELAAAVGTGDYAHIESRYGVEVPEGMRASLGRSIDNFLRRLKELLNDLFGRPVFTDEDVRGLLDAAREASKSEGDTIGGMAESTADEDYRGEHTAPMKDSGAPAHDVTGGGNFYPDDVYSSNGLRYYGTGEPGMDSEAYSIIQRLRNHPNYQVTIYRAVPKSVKSAIKPGDWVTTVRRYASDHGRGALNGDYKIQSKLVHARDIFTNGDSWLEWGYDPQPFDHEAERALQERRAAKKAAQGLESTEPAQTDTPAFRKWFGSSKVVDAQGKPLVVYHGTEATPFDVFDRNKAGSGPSKFGFWFTNQESFADLFGGNKIPVYLKAENPKRITLAQWNSIRDKHATDGAWFNDWREQLMGQGHDGLLVIGGTDQVGRFTVENPDVLAVFEPTQIKSATANNGNFDASKPSILENVEPVARAESRRDEAAQTLPVARGAAGWNYDSNRWEGRAGQRNAARAHLQDKMLAWRDVQGQIESQLQRAIPDAQNVYRLENLMHGRVSDGIDKIEREQVKPLIHAMHEAKVQPATLEEYLYARHAPERNAQVASINPGMPDGGSGMTNAEAAKILAGADKATLEPLARKVDAITRATRRRMLQHGLITQEAFDAMEAQYQHYVPLRGKSTSESEDFGGVGMAGRGLDSRGKIVRNALGRGAGNRAQHILGEVIGDAERSVILAEKARVGRAVMRLVLANPNPALWEVEPVQTQRALDASGEVYEKVVNDWSDPSVVAVRHNGQLYKVQINSVPLAQAMNNIGVDKIGWLTSKAGAVNRFFSAILTKYNPAFTPVNATRDAIFGLTGLAAEHGEAAALDAALHYPQAAAAAFQQARGKTLPGEWGTWADEFAAHGGKTGYVNMPSAEDIARKIGKGTLTSYSPEGLRKAARAIGDVVGVLNDAVENALRLSAYATLRKRGATPDAAAAYAKDLTVNFNRKGFDGSKLNAWFLFYNASIQGGHRVSKLLRKPKTYAYLGALASAQVIATLAAMGMHGDDDDEPLWNKVPDHVKRRNLVIVTPDGGLITIPMPYGFNLFPYLAGRITEAVANGNRGDDRPSDHAAQLTADALSAATQSLSPVPLDTGAFGLLPNILRIPVNIQANRNDFGNPIRDESPYGKSDVPHASMGRPDTLEVFKLTARGLNRIGGGDDLTPPPLSAFDVAPEDIEYLLTELTGGPGQLVTDIATAGQKVTGGGYAQPLEARDVPITKRFLSGINEQAAQQALYYDRRETIDRSLKRVRAAYTSQGAEAAEALLAATPELKGAAFKRRKREGKHGEEPGSIIESASGGPQIVVGDERAVFGRYKAAEDAISDRRDDVDAAYAQAPASLLPTQATRQRDAHIRTANTIRQAAQADFNAAWIRDVVGSAE